MARFAGPEEIRRGEELKKLIDTVAWVMFAGPDATYDVEGEYRPSSDEWLLAGSFVEALRRRGYDIVPHTQEVPT